MSGWTAEDDATLRRSLESANGQKLWPQVALAAFPDGQYSKRACMERWKILSKPKPLRGPWTKDEDAKLEGLVKNFGSEKWVVIATEMATRSGKQCRERWHNHLDPRINKGEWTAEEDELIHRLFSQIGSRWAEMAKHLPGRPDNAIKNYYNASLIRQKRRRGDSISSLTATLEISESPVMTRSNSITSPRYSPYVRGGAAMSKSRSEQQFGSPKAAAHRRGSVGDFHSPSQLATFSPLAKSRSQNFQPPSPYSPPVTRRQTERPQTVVAPRNLSEDVFDHHSSNLPAGYRFTPPSTPERPPSTRPLPLDTSAKYPYAYSAPPSPPLSATYQTSSLQEAFSRPAWTETQNMDHITDAESYISSPPFSLVQLDDQEFHQEFQPYTYSNLEDHYLDEKYALPSHLSSEQLYQSHSLAYSDSSTSYCSSYESTDSMHAPIYHSPQSQQNTPFIHPLHQLSPNQAFDYAQNGHWGKLSLDLSTGEEGMAVINSDLESNALEMYLNPFSDETVQRSVSPVSAYTYNSGSPIESVLPIHKKLDLESESSSFSPSRMSLRSSSTPSKLAAPISLSSALLSTSLSSVEEYPHNLDTSPRQTRSRKKIIKEEYLNSTTLLPSPILFEGLMIQTEDSLPRVSNFNAYQGLAAWNATSHPTSDLMEVDINGRARLPGTPILLE